MVQKHIKLDLRPTLGAFENTLSYLSRGFEVHLRTSFGPYIVYEMVQPGPGHTLTWEEDYGKGKDLYPRSAQLRVVSPSCAASQGPPVAAGAAAEEF